MQGFLAGSAAFKRELRTNYHCGSSPLPERVILVFAALGVIKYGLGANHMPPPPQVCVFIEDLSDEIRVVHVLGDSLFCQSKPIVVPLNDWEYRPSSKSCPILMEHFYAQFILKVGKSSYQQKAHQSNDIIATVKSHPPPHCQQPM